MTTLRDARPDNLDAVAALFLRCWRESYVDVLPPTAIDVFDEAGATELWRRALLTPRPGTRGVVAVSDVDDRVVGVVRMGRGPDDETVGHVFSLYVDPGAQGGGVGRALLSEAARWLRDQGLAEATLWVFEANRRARTFYAMHGWLPDGGARTEPGFEVPEVRLRRVIQGAAR